MSNHLPQTFGRVGLPSTSPLGECDWTLTRKYGWTHFLQGPGRRNKKTWSELHYVKTHILILWAARFPGGVVAWVDYKECDGAPLIPSQGDTEWLSGCKEAITFQRITRTQVCLRTPSGTVCLRRVTLIQTQCGSGAASFLCLERGVVDGIGWRGCDQGVQGWECFVHDVEIK